MSLRTLSAVDAVTCVLFVGALVAGVRWSAHQRIVASLHAKTVSATNVVSAYSRVQALLEAKQLARNRLLDRVAATSKNTGGQGAFPTLGPMSERLDDLRRGTHLDDVAGTARTALPRADVRDMDHDLTLLLKRQDDSRAAIAATSALLRSILADPFAAVSLLASIRTTMDHYTKSEDALKQSFADVRRDLDRHARRALDALSADRGQEKIARRKSFTQGILES